MSETPRDKTEAKIYDALVSFNQTAQWNVLRLAQMRQYLAEHIANALVPTWLHERKAETAGEEIAHVLLMFGLFPDDWMNDYRAEVLAEEKTTPEVGAAVTPGFFEVGRTYTSGTWQFRCEAITPSPSTGEARALGWKRSPVHGVHLWHAEALDPDDWEHGGWVEVTDGGDR
jgi:hypothetical protein